MSNHTPGPWYMTMQADNVSAIESGAEVEGKLLTIFVYDGQPTDAHLIAAAPELLKALQFAKSVIKSGEPWTAACDDLIDGALAKARGETT